MGFFILLYIAVAVIVIKLTKKLITTNSYVIKTLIVIAVLIPTYDIIITNILGVYYCLAEPNPKMLIKKKVEYPLSIYWEDNIYPGFNAEDRKLMIMNYLDGVHLKNMALNGDDGKVYVYHLDKPMWEKIKKEFDASKYKDIYEQYTQYVINTSEQVYTKVTMPQMNYTVQFDEIKLNMLSRKFLYSDETKIIDNTTQKTIAYNRRYMPFWYNIAPDFALGNRYYSSWVWEICQQENHERYEEKVFSSLNYHYYEADAPTLNEKLYNKYIKGEK